jgi:hypothetical protein
MPRSARTGDPIFWPERAFESRGNPLVLGNAGRGRSGATAFLASRSSLKEVPEYLAPGVYVEEVSYRGKSIEGVSTTTDSFVGATRRRAEIVAGWFVLLLVGVLLGAAGSAAVSWAWHRRRQCRGR